MNDSIRRRSFLALCAASFAALGAVLFVRAPVHPGGARWQGAVAILGAWPGWALVRSFRRRGRDRLEIDDIPGGGLYLGRGFDWTPLHVRTLIDRAAGGFSGGLLHALGRPEERDLMLPPELLGQHLLVLGTTGVGKTRMLELLAAQAIRRGDATAIIDPKGDAGLLARVADECRRSGRRLQLFAPPYPSSSVAYNPVSSYADVREVADRVAALLPAGGEAEPFRNFGWELANTVASALDRYDRPVTLANLRRYGLEDPWALLRELLPGGKEPDRLAARARASGVPELEALAGLASRPRDHSLKMASSLLPVLAKLTAGNNRDLLSPEGPSFSWNEFDRGRGVAYFFLGSLLGSDTASAIAKLALLDFQSHLGAKYAYERDHRPVSLIVDELADVVTPAFVNVLNKGRGAGLRLAIAAQTQADLEAALGSKARAEQVIGNVNTVLQFRAQSQADAEQFSSLTGERLMPVSSEGEAYEPAIFSSGFRTVDDFRAVFSRQKSWRPEPLVPAWAVMELPVFHYFARWSGTAAKGVVPLLPRVPEVDVEGFRDENSASLFGGPGPGGGLGLDAKRRV